MLVFWIGSSYGQLDTSKATLIHFVEAKSFRAKIIESNSTYSIDSSSLFRHLGGAISDVLQRNTPIALRSYGPGNLSTTSVRGGTAQQTSVLWNGFNIQNPMLGQNDLSTLPVGIIDDLTFAAGGNAALNGNATQAGMIGINNVKPASNATSILISNEVGSFGKLSNLARLKTAGKSIGIDISAYRQSAQNNFLYLNPFAGNENTRSIQSNSDYLQYGGLAQLYGKIGKYNEFNVRVWIQDNERGTGKPLALDRSTARLHNKFLRTSAEFKRYHRNSTTKIASAFFNEHLNYNNSLSDLVSNSQFYTSLVTIENERKLNDLIRMNVGVLQTLESVNNDSYTLGTTRLRFAPYLLLLRNSKNQKLISKFGLRKEWNHQLINAPFTGHLGLIYNLSDFVQVESNYSRNYRLPTLNDLYYQPGGNTEILPENGWNIDAAAKWTRKLFEAKVTYFRNEYYNRIVWQPSTNGYWTAGNTYSKGHGIEFSARIKSNPTRNHMAAGWIGTLQKSEDANGLNVLYVPNSMGNIFLEVNKPKWNLKINNQYMGKRTLWGSNVAGGELASFNLVDIMFNYTLKLQKHSNITLGSLGLKVLNVLNKNYQMDISYPMPGRNYSVQLNILLNRKRKTQ